MSAKVTYLGEEDGPEVVTLHGTRFLVGKAVEVSDDTAIRLMGNPFFEQEAGATDKAHIAEKVAIENSAAAKAAAVAPAPVLAPKPVVKV